MWGVPEIGLLLVQMYSTRFKYIQIYLNRLSTNPDAHLANARESGGNIGTTLKQQDPEHETFTEV